MIIPSFFRQGCTVDALLLKQSLVQTSQDQILTPSKQIVESLSTPIPAVSRKSQTALHPPLDSLINVENFKSESVMNIEKLWTLFNSTKSCILCGSLTLDFHSILFQRAKKNPMVQNTHTHTK